MNIYIIYIFLGIRFWVKEKYNCIEWFIYIYVYTYIIYIYGLKGLWIEYFNKHVFAFDLYIKIHSSMKIDHVNREYFAQQIVQCYDQ